MKIGIQLVRNLPADNEGKRGGKKNKGKYFIVTCNYKTPVDTWTVLCCRFRSLCRSSRNYPMTPMNSSEYRPPGSIICLFSLDRNQCLFTQRQKLMNLMYYQNCLFNIQCMIFFVFFKQYGVSIVSLSRRSKFSPWLKHVILTPTESGLLVLSSLT